MSGAALQRQKYCEGCPARLAVALDHAVMVLNKSLGQSQPQSAAAFPPGYQGEENPIAYFRRNTRPVIRYLQF